MTLEILEIKLEMTTNSILLSGIKEKAKKLGFDDVGFCNASVSSAISKNLVQFVKEGWHGEMHWMIKNLDRRKSPINLWKDAKSAVVVLVNYSINTNPLKDLKKKNKGLISIYAKNKDYHQWIKGRLKNLANWTITKTKGQVKVFVDTAPIMEKPLAQAAGLGWIGKHTNLISRNLGNWTFIGIMLLDVDIAPKVVTTKDSCGSCSHCLDICPTKAFPQPYKLDARKCISYLTIEHKTHIPRKYRTLMGNRIYGCDDCLAVCPWNKFAKVSNHIAFLANKKLDNITLKKLSKLNKNDFRIFFSGSPIKRIGRDRFLRNVLIAMGNSSADIMIPDVIRLLNDQSSLVRVAAVWALSKLNKKRFKEEKYKYFNVETDNEVKKEWLLNFNENNEGLKNI